MLAAANHRTSMRFSPSEATPLERQTRGIQHVAVRPMTCKQLPAPAAGGALVGRELSGTTGGGMPLLWVGCAPWETTDFG